MPADGFPPADCCTILPLHVHFFCRGICRAAAGTRPSSNSPSTRGRSGSGRDQQLLQQRQLKPQQQQSGWASRSDNPPTYESISIDLVRVHRRRIAVDNFEPTAVTTILITLPSTAIGMALPMMNSFSHKGFRTMKAAPTHIATNIIIIRKPLHASSTFRLPVVGQLNHVPDGHRRNSQRLNDEDAESRGRRPATAG